MIEGGREGEKEEVKEKMGVGRGGKEVIPDLNLCTFDTAP